MSRAREDRFHRALLVRRLVRLTGLTLGALALIALGYWRVQVAEGAYYRQLADNNRLRKQRLEAARGWIYDRAGRPLAENIPNYALSIDRSLARDLDATFRFVSKLLAVPTEVLAMRFATARSGPRFAPVVIADHLSLETVARASVEQLEHPEIGIEISHRRLYRLAHQTAHILGYLGEATPRDLRDHPLRYRPGDLVGKQGVEKLFDHTLRGRDGARVVVVDSHGRFKEEFDNHPAEPGQALHLTLDVPLQHAAAHLLEGKVGAIIAMEPFTGEILAMASSPSFDPNRFAGRLDAKSWQALLDNPQHPLQNRALQNSYPPGSVFKIVMAAAALETGIDPKDSVYCRGFSIIDNHRYRCWNAAGHGRVDLRAALKHSCNVYFHHLGQRLDIDQIARYARRFGLGQATGIELAGELRGLVPDRQWSLQTRSSRWYPGETISVATGQGPLLVTPLQVATLMAALANGGALVRPRLVRDEPPAASRRPDPRLHPATLAFLRDALDAVVNEPHGTGHSAHIRGFPIAGKTGTAQVVRQATRTSNQELAPDQRDHAWFASFAPVDHPQLVVVVFVEHGGAGSKVAAPLARALYETFLAGRSRNRPAA